MEESLDKFDINVADKSEWRSRIMKVKKCTPLLIVQKKKTRQATHAAEGEIYLDECYDEPC